MKIVLFIYVTFTFFSFVALSNTLSVRQRNLSFLKFRQQYLYKSFDFLFYELLYFFPYYCYRIVSYYTYFSTLNFSFFDFNASNNSTFYIFDLSF